MFAQLEILLLSIVDTMPLEAFVVVASFIEEVVAPIPSPTVMVLAGTLASAQEIPLAGLVMLAILGAIGKTVGAFCVYEITDRAEDFVMHKCAHFFSVTHEDVERLGKRLGNGLRDYVLLTTFRALPFIPSVVVSVGSGLLKIPMKLFLVSTFLGTIIRDGLYLYTGYIGAHILSRLIERFGLFETLFEVAFVIVFLYFLARIIKKKKTPTAAP